MQQLPATQKDSPGWHIFVWCSFILSVGMTAIGIYHMPTDLWIKAFMIMGLLFSVGSSFTLAKTIRDNFEAQRMINRAVDAKTDKILQEYERRSA